MTALLAILTGALLVSALVLLARVRASRRTRSADGCGDAADSGWFGGSFDGGGADCSGADGGGCDGGGGGD